MAEPVTLVGLHAQALALGWSLRRRGLDVTLVEDSGDLLAGFGGATHVSPVPPELASMLAALDPELELCDPPVRVVSALGAVRTVSVAHRQLLRLLPGEPVHVVSFIGWREWSAATIADGLRAARVPAEIAAVPLMGSAPDASHAELQRRMSDVAFRAELTRALEDARRVLLPPILAETGAGVSVRAILASELGLEEPAIGVGVPCAPSPLGERHLARVTAAFGVLRDATFERAGEVLCVAGRTGPVLAFGPRAHARVRAADAGSASPAENVRYVAAARPLGEAWARGLAWGASWPS